MTKSEQLQQFKELQNPALRMQRLATERMTGKAIDRMNLVKGEKGDEGKPGYSPIKGKDYFTKSEIDQISSYILSRLLTEKKGEKGAPGLNGSVGKNGRDGFTPELGVHYWTKLDQIKIVQDVLANITIPKDGVSPKIEDIVAELRKQPVQFKDIKGTEQLIAFLKLGGFRGGGSSSSSSVTFVNNEIPTGSGTSFTLASTPTVGSVQLYRGGARQNPGAGNDYTISGSAITLASSLSSGETLLADYRT